MFSIALQLIFAVLTAAHRDVSQTLNDLHDITAGANNLTTITNAWDGQIAGANDISTSTNVLADLVDTANHHAAEGDVATSEDSVAIRDYITETSQPSVAASIDAVVARKADLDTAGASPDILDAMQSLKSKVDAYATTLWVITSEDQRDSVRSAIGQLDTDFAKVIGAFS
ncbi:hypothetical protein PFICI_05417 [Pestalotiopsis fici W106-1]|uniref:Fungal N-terminal domain-containing protein n=1 Tax=Pestalotiopsis fici (strain W106-1 / CGMCC3.15140) TaxID=1229662 RepID=W3XEB2_PESFW|nr:uncharacterized protein PFICI_05417 [Pestalotiopsis fici W106-1]ETS83541.1 hypothetical protein PFICI_05417 [Pestalotiopsis fici W106-1]